jgi:phosphatidyl-myo-inositol alpha-mannosyltransferase
LGLAATALVGAALTYLAATRIGFQSVADAALRSDLSWVLGATALMIASMFLRAEAWHAIARSAIPRARLRRRDVTSATMIGVLMSATLPARLGEPARAMVLARRAGGMRESFPVLLGTLVSQAALNIVALVLLGAIVVGSTNLFSEGTTRLFVASAAPLLLLAAVLAGPALLRGEGASRSERLRAAGRNALTKVRRGLAVFRDRRNGPVAAVAQLAAWGLQLLSCLVLFTALGFEDAATLGVGAAAAVLFAVNVTAVVPATPSNVGVFQLAVISVLTTGFGVGAADALAYGVILQAVEIATAVALGVPALVREGATWSEMRLRALSTAPVVLDQRLAS